MGTGVYCERDERDDQQQYSSEETMKRWGKEVGADYMLGGIISSITDEIEGETATVALRTA